MLGNAPDAEIAETHGISVGTVYGYRKKLGIESHRLRQGDESRDEPQSMFGQDNPATPETEPRGRKINPRLQGDKRYYCYNCGTPWSQEATVCNACGGTDRSLGAARPTRAAKNDLALFDGPWRLIPWPGQGTVAMFGGPGAGKSSLAGLIKPTTWITREQEPKPVGDMFRRILPGFMPGIVSVDTPEDVKRVLSETTRGPIVLDSLTAFGLREALMVAHLLVKWAQRHNDRALAIIQLNKDGQAAGYMEIPHLFDAIINVSPDPWGVRAFRVTKSRWSPLDAIYWTFDDEGKLNIPTFPAAYSVEGGPGEYWLHPYPLKGAKWTGLFEALEAVGELKPQTASAAIVAGYMPGGFYEPMDASERRRFAEQNGLNWMSAREAALLIANAPPPASTGKNR